jgi:predicted metal-dependent HD superfamily phosphohydrolase
MEKVISKETVTESLIRDALSELTAKYGTGNGDGQNPKNYHNLIHTQDVIAAAKQIAQSSPDLPLVEIAAAFHDLEQDLGSGPNEKSSAATAAKKMTETGSFTENEIHKVTTMILATTAHFENGTIIQAVTPGDYLSQILADADLSALGREPTVYWQKTLDLSKEIPNTDILAFTRLQITLLKNHQFYTAEAAELFPHQQQNLKFIEDRLTGTP